MKGLNKVIDESCEGFIKGDLTICEWKICLSKELNPSGKIDHSERYKINF